MGGFAERAAPAGVFWAGVKYGVLGAAGLLKDMAREFGNCSKEQTRRTRNINEQKRRFEAVLNILGKLEKDIVSKWCNSVNSLCKRGCICNRGKSA